MPKFFSIMVLNFLTVFFSCFISVKVCVHWRMVADRDELWERKLKKDFNINENTSLRPGGLIF